MEKNFNMNLPNGKSPAPALVGNQNSSSMIETNNNSEYLPFIIQNYNLFSSTHSMLGVSSSSYNK